MKNQEKPTKKIVFSRDRLPVDFPHYKVIYFWIINQFNDWGLITLIITSILLFLFLLVYFYRKSIEKPQ